ncbi:MAG: phosphohistidine phosphatase SixA [Thermotogae bacterium]|nr:phosphohistidine phosphatase SixA [Thermotogota bacterium]
MNLYLVQHAEPKRKEEDPQRPLSEKGKADIKKIADFIVKHTNIRVKSIMHSGKLRARQTAEILAEYLNPPEEIKEVKGLEPLADPSIWVNHLIGVKEDMMLVGHLPHLMKLSSYLLCQDVNKKIVDFHMGGIVCLNKDEGGIWSVQWVLTPEIL